MANAQGGFDVPDDWGLAGKVAIVTGGGAAGDGIGNGRASAILLARGGTRVVVVDRDVALAKRTVEMIEASGGEALAFQADVTRGSDCAAMVEAALERFGRLDFLDNNVGIGSRGSVVDESEERWRRLMAVNVDTMFLAAKHAIPPAPRRRRGDRQRVVDLRPAAARAHRLLRLQGRRHRADARDGFNGTGPRFEDTGNNIITGGNRDWNRDRRRNQVLGTLSYFKDGWGGDHNFKVRRRDLPRDDHRHLDRRLSRQRGAPPEQRRRQPMCICSNRAKGTWDSGPTPRLPTTRGA